MNDATDIDATSDEGAAETPDPRRKFLLLAAAGIVGASVASDTSAAGAASAALMSETLNTTGNTTTIRLVNGSGARSTLDVQAEGGMAAIVAGGRPTNSDPNNLISSPAVGIWAKVDAAQVVDPAGAPTIAAVYGHGMGGALGLSARAESGAAVEAYADSGNGVEASGDTGVVGSGSVGVRGRVDTSRSNGTIDEFGLDGRGSAIGARGVGRMGVVGIAELTDESDPGTESAVRTVLEQVPNAGVVGIGVRVPGQGGSGLLGVGDIGVLGRSFADVGAGLHGEAPNGIGVSGSGATGVEGRSDTADGAGVQGANENGAGVRGEGATGVHGRSDTADGHGVRGESAQGAGVRGDVATGVHGRSDTADGHGVRGENAQGAGVRGDGATGVHGRSEAANGRGVHGEAAHEGGAGVRGDNPNGDAVRGEGKTGIHGRSQATDGHGVHGENANGSGVHGQGKTGVHGRSDTADGHGVRGENANGVGVRADGLTGVEARAPRGGVGLRAVVGQEVAANSSAARATIAVAEDPEISVGIVAIGDVGLDVTGTESALHVRGKACFDATGRSGRSNGTATVPNVPRSSTSVRVRDVRVTEDSIVHLMLASDPGRGPGNSQICVSWIDVTAGSGFEVHLTNPAQREVQFRYFITEPC